MMENANGSRSCMQGPCCSRALTQDPRSPFWLSQRDKTNPKIFLFLGGGTVLVLKMMK
jgi:hypothetical protein